MSEQKRIRSRAGACEHKKKCDYLGCKCVVLTLFYFRVRHEHLTKNIASCSFVLVISASFVLFFFLEVSLLVLLLDERFFPHSFIRPHLFYIIRKLRSALFSRFVRKRVFYSRAENDRGKKRRRRNRRRILSVRRQIEI